MTQSLKPQLMDALLKRAQENKTAAAKRPQAVPGMMGASNQMGMGTATSAPESINVSAMSHGELAALVSAGLQRNFQLQNTINSFSGFLNGVDNRLRELESMKSEDDAVLQGATALLDAVLHAKNFNDVKVLKNKVSQYLNANFTADDGKDKV